MIEKDWLIIADGEPLEKTKTQALAMDKSVIALDGALKQCLDYDIIPDIVIGDFDSLDTNLIENAKANYAIAFIENSCQNSTDLEKALNYLYEIQAQTINICHATGWRLDHSLYNLRLLKRFQQKFTQLMLTTKLEKVYFFKDQKLTLSGSANQAVALLSFPQAKITTSGLKYDMQNFELKHGYQESTSNQLESNHADIEINGEVLLLVSHEISITY